MTSTELLKRYMEERHALGFVAKTDEGRIRRFLQNYVDPPDGTIEFTKEYVLQNIGNHLNQQTNTVLRDVSAVNGFLDFAIRRGFKAYKIPPRSLPKLIRNFKAYIFTDDEINRILEAADHVPFSKWSPMRHLQIPVMFRILFNCGLRSSELLRLRVCNVDLADNVFTIQDTKFHKNRLVPFSQTVADTLKAYLEAMPLHSEDALLFPSASPRNTTGVYGLTWLHTQFHLLLKMADIPYGGRGKGPRPHDIRHTFAVHCLNNWVFSGEDLTAALPVLSRYLGHSNLTGTQHYLQLTAQMYPDIVSKMEEQFGGLIPIPEALCENS